MPDRWEVGALRPRQHTVGIRRAGQIVDDNDALRVYRQNALMIAASVLVAEYEIKLLSRITVVCMWCKCAVNLG
jgi:hypothetical protein